MAHKTLVNYTAYEISGGKTLVEGTSYSVKNGKVLVGGTEYDISFLLPPAALYMWSNDGQLNCITYANGYYVVGGWRYASGVYHAQIAYATELNGTWTIKELWSSDEAEDNAGCEINCVTYANGYWVVGGSSVVGGYNKGRIAYTSSSPSESWTIKDLWSTIYSSTCVKCIAYGDDGYWVAGGKTYDSSNFIGAYISYSTTLNAIWSHRYLWRSTYNSDYDVETIITSVAYSNGHWVAVGEYGSSTSTAKVGYATSPYGDWTTKDLWSTSNSTNPEARITCVTPNANGYWIAGGYLRYGYNVNMEITGYIAYSSISNPANFTAINTGLPMLINSITYADGYYVIAGMYYDKSTDDCYAAIAYSTTIGTNWTVIPVWTSENVASSVFDGDWKGDIDEVINVNGYWIVVGTKYTSARLAYSSDLAGLSDM